MSQDTKNLLTYTYHKLFKDCSIILYACEIKKKPFFYRSQLLQQYARKLVWTPPFLNASAQAPNAYIIQATRSRRTSLSP